MLHVSQQFENKISSDWCINFFGNNVPPKLNPTLNLIDSDSKFHAIAMKCHFSLLLHIFNCESYPSTQHQKCNAVSGEPPSKFTVRKAIYIELVTRCKCQKITVCECICFKIMHYMMKVF